MDKLVSFFLKRKVFTLMLYLIILIFGLISIKFIKMELIPSLKSYQLSIGVSWPDISPEIVESKIISPVESFIATLQGIDSISSETERGKGSIIITLKRGENLLLFKNSIRERLKEFTLPENSSINLSDRLQTAGESLSDRLLKDFSKADTKGVTLRISSKVERDIDKIILDRIKNNFLSLPEISSVDVSGEKEFVIEIILDSSLMDDLGITHEFIAGKISKEIVTTHSIGEITQDGQIIKLLFKNYNVDENKLKSLSFKTDVGIFTLADIATINLNESLISHRSRVNQREALIIQILKKDDANLIQFSKSVAQQIEKIDNSVLVEKLEDSGEELTKIIEDMVIRLTTSLIVIFFILLLFFKKGKPAIIVFLTLVASLLLTLTAMNFLHYSLNMISISALILSSGMLIDNTLVIYEIIQGSKTIESISKKMGKIIGTIGASSLTNVAIFTPFLFFSDSLKSIFIPFAIISFLSMFFSLFVSITLTPTLYYLIIAKEDNKTSRAIYLPKLNLLKKGLRYNKYLAIPFLILLFSYLSIGFINLWNTPPQNNGRSSTELSLSLRFLPDTEFEECEKIVTQLENKVMSLVIKNNLQLLSRYSRDSARLTILQKESSSISTIQKIWQMTLSNYAPVGYSMDGPLGKSGRGIMPDSSSSGEGILVTGYDYYVLKKIVNELSENVNRIKYINSVETGFQDKKSSFFGPIAQGYNLIVDDNKLNMAGLTVETLLETIKSWDQNRVVISQLEHKPISLNYLGTFFNGDEILNLKIPNMMYVLRDFCTLKSIESSPEITRSDQKYIHTINYNIRGSYYLEATKSVKAVLASYDFPPGYAYILLSDIVSEEHKEKLSMIWVLLGSVILVFMILSAHFESFTYPFYVFLSIPLSFTGVLILLQIMNKNISIGVILGCITLAGLSVNDALLFFSNKNKDSLAAIKSRIRPILITSLSTIIALLPSAILNSDMNQISLLWSDYSLTVISGLSASTFLTIYYLPVLYEFLSSIKSNR